MGVELAAGLERGRGGREGREGGAGRPGGRRRVADRDRHGCQRGREERAFHGERDEFADRAGAFPGGAVGDRKLLQMLTDHRTAVDALAFDADGERLE